MLPKKETAPKATPKKSTKIDGQTVVAIETDRNRKRECCGFQIGGIMKKMSFLSLMIIFLLLATISYGQWLETTIPVGSNPYALVYNPTNNKIYSANWGSYSVSVIDGETNSVITTIPLENAPRTLVYNPTNNKVYTANYYDNSVTVIDGETDNVTTEIPVGTFPCAFAYNLTYNKVYCANYYSNTVSVINGETNGVITTIPVGTYPVALGYNPTGNKIYSANYYSNNVTVIDGASNSVITTITAGSYPNAFAYNPTNNKVYCANGGSYTVTVIDGATDSVITTIPVGRWPLALAHNPADNKIYCANSWRDTVSVIDGETDSVIATIPVGDEPYALVYNPINNKVYCANPGLYPSSPDSTITVIDGETNSVITTIEVGNGPKALTYNPQYNRVYSANYYGNSVSVIRDGMPEFSVTPTSIAFGDVNVDSSKTDSVAVTNTGTETLDITSVVSDNAEFTVTPTTGSLAPAESTEFYITFAPTNAVVDTGNIIFTHNATTSPDTITVTGTGVEFGDIGCLSVVSPPADTILPGDYDVIGQIHNFGGSSATFDVTANVYDTTDAWTLIFTQTMTITDLPSGTDSTVDFDIVGLESDKVFYTEIFTLLSGDQNPSNDTASIYSNTCPTGVEEQPMISEPLVFGFASSMPNPIKKHVTVSYTTTVQGKVSLKIYDCAGRLIRTLVNVNANLPAGMKSVYWDGKDDTDRKISDGVYFLRLEAENKIATCKLILVR